ncbi:unnamed protein product [Musa acuminata subsp. burmannicoides]
MPRQPGVSATKPSESSQTLDHRADEMCHRLHLHLSVEYASFQSFLFPCVFPNTKFNVRHRAIFFSRSRLKKTTTRITKLWFQSTQITSYMTIQTISVTTSHGLRVFCPATPLMLIVHPTCVMEDEVSIYLKFYVKFYLLFYYFNIH